MTAAMMPGRSPADPLLSVDQLEVVYNHVHLAVQGVSLHVMPGQLVALLGTNGAGKTTVLRAISGFLPSDNASISEGVIRLGDREITGHPPHVTVRHRVVLVPERDKVFGSLTVDGNLRSVPRLGSPAGRRQALEMIGDLFPALAQRRGQLAGYLSGGERQMLAIARALLLQPELLLVDELSFGLAPALARQLMTAVSAINQSRGMAVILVEQNAGAALEIADHAYIMERGRVVYDGSPDSLRGNSAVRDFYLGLAESSDRSYADAGAQRRRRR